MIADIFTYLILCVFEIMGTAFVFLGKRDLSAEREPLIVSGFVSVVGGIIAGVVVILTGGIG